MHDGGNDDRAFIKLMVSMFIIIMVSKSMTTMMTLTVTMTMKALTAIETKVTRDVLIILRSVPFS